MSFSIIAPFNIGLSDFFLKSLITFAGAFPISDNITEVFPLSVSKRSPKSLSEDVIAFSRSVFFITLSLTPDLKHILLRLDVSTELSPEISVK